MKPNANDDTLKSVNESYETAAAVEALTNWYAVPKERAFVQHLFDGLEVPSSGMLVEIGGGAGIQGLLVRDLFQDRYLHSDYSAALVMQAKKRGLNSMVVDGLSMPFADASVAALLLTGPTTIIHEQAMRDRQFEECARVLASRGVLIMITSRLAFLKRYHCLDREDLAKLASLGFDPVRFASWGMLPGKWWRPWNQKLFSSIESLAGRLGLGVRRILVARKR